MSAAQREFSGKHALITGAASGIGRELAFSFAERGATLELADVDAQGLERTALLCRNLSVEVHTHVVDVSSAEQMAALAGRIHARVAALDFLINNAGVGVGGSFIGTELATWSWALGVNLMGVVHGCHFFVPKMVERGRGGHVVNMASLAGIVAAKRMSVYSTTKFAVVGMSESLRAELEPHGIEVTTVCPGIIDTAITRSTRLTGDLALDAAARQRSMDFYRARAYGPERVAEIVARAMHAKGRLLPVSPESWAFYFGKRIAPKLVEKILSRDPP